METPLGRVRGLGPARSGARHWWTERLTSVSTLLLLIWLLVSLLRLPGLDRGAVVEWLASPANAVAMLLLIGSSFWHIRLGMQVIIEDYVHEDGNKLFLFVLLNFFCIVAAVIGFFSVLKIAFAGTGA
ncbi:MAG: succinate dehydrogenase, hydrophobic membrane anchor protein [Sphingomonadales bacterium]